MTTYGASAERYANPTEELAIGNIIRSNRVCVNDWKCSAAQSKYRNKKTITPDGEFDSRKEAARFAELQILERAGRIKDLKRQVSFEIIPAQRDENGKLLEHAAHYIADFTYTENGDPVVEDVKSPVTRKEKAYVLKRKLMLLKYGVRIKET